MKRKPLPPFGKQYLDELPCSGIQIAIGPNAWNFSKRMQHIVMVLPPGESPWNYKWPSSTEGVLLHERGQFDDESLEEMATVLLVAGNPFVVARRSAMMDSDPVLKMMDINPALQTGPKFDPDKYVHRDRYPMEYGDPMVWFYPESSNGD